MNECVVFPFLWMTYQLKQFFFKYVDPKTVDLWAALRFLNKYWFIVIRAKY